MKITIKLDPLTIILLATFVPIFIAELVVTLVYRKLSIYRIDHNEQPIELTYPVEIQFTNPNETNDSNQPMEQDPDREQTNEPSIR